MSKLKRDEPTMQYKKGNKDDIGKAEMKDHHIVNIMSGNITHHIYAHIAYYSERIVLTSYRTNQTYMHRQIIVMLVSNYYNSRIA